MFNYDHYVPVLKSKSAEFWALKGLSYEIKAKITPLMEIIPVPWDHKKNLPTKTIKKHLEDNINKIEKSWGGNSLFNVYPIFFDFVYVSSEEYINGYHPMKYFFDELRKLGVQGIPTYSYELDDECKSEIKNIVKEDKRGVCIRLNNEDLKKNIEKNFIEDMLKDFNLSPQQCNLILDFQCLPVDGVDNLFSYAKDVIRNFPYICEWKTFTFIASSFPRTLQGMPENSMEVFPRNELELWKKLRKSRSSLPRLPAFGDYCIQHPIFEDIDLRAVDQKVNLRYATTDGWLVYRKRGWKKFGNQQFIGICQDLVGRKEYGGPPLSGGDSHIERCAKKIRNGGNPTIWRQVGFSHHIALTANQIL